MSGDASPTTATEEQVRDVAKHAAAFLYWYEANEHTVKIDGRTYYDVGVFVCAEWYNLQYALREAGMRQPLRSEMPDAE